MASITQRSKDSYRITIFLGRDPVTGKLLRHRETVKGTKKEAQRVARELEHKRDTGGLATDSQTSLKDYLPTWLETSAKPRLRTNTYNAYESRIRLYLVPHLGNYKLHKLKPIDIQNAYGKLMAQGLSSVTVRDAHKVLRSALTQAVKWQLIPNNPCQYVDLPKIEHKEMLYMSDGESQQFLAASKLNKWHPLFTMMLTTGLRPSEALALSWQDVDFNNNVIRVRRKLTMRKGGYLFEPPKTKRSNRAVDFPVSLTDILLEHQERQAYLGEYDSDLSLVFANQKGKPCDERNILHRHFRPVLKAAGLNEELRMYDLRHTHATLLLIAGTHPKIVSERLGHSSIAITLDTYSHVIPTMQQEAAVKINDMLFTQQDETKVFN